MHSALLNHRGPRRRAASGRRVGLLTAVSAISLAGAVVIAVPAAAHDRLTGSTPAAGSTVTAPPDEVRLTFTDQVEPIGLTVLITDPGGASLTRGKPVVEGTSVVQQVLPITVSGSYSVVYRVVSSDGHPISGKLRFSATLPVVSSGQPAPSASVAEPVSTPSALAAQPAAAATPATGSAWVAVGAGLLAALAIAGVVAARRRSV